MVAVSCSATMAAGDPPTSRPALTLTDAAKACGVSRITLRRRLDADAFPNAYRTDGPKGAESGPWLIPVDDLLAADFHLHRPDLGGSPASEIQPTGEPAAPDTDAELSRARDELTRLRHERDLYQALAIERGDALTDLRIALRALEAPRAATIVEPARRRGLFRRRPRAPETSSSNGSGTP